MSDIATELCILPNNLNMKNLLYDFVNVFNFDRLGQWTIHLPGQGKRRFEVETSVYGK